MIPWWGESEWIWLKVAIDMMPNMFLQKCVAERGNGHPILFFVKKFAGECIQILRHHHVSGKPHAVIFPTSYKYLNYCIYKLEWNIVSTFLFNWLPWIFLVAFPFLIWKKPLRRGFPWCSGSEPHKARFEPWTLTTLTTLGETFFLGLAAKLVVFKNLEESRDGKVWLVWLFFFNVFFLLGNS